MTIREANDRLAAMLTRMWPLEDVEEIGKAYMRVREITPLFTKEETKDERS